MRTGLLLSLLALLALLGIVWWASRPEPAATGSTTVDKEQIQDYFVYQLELRQFDEQGQLSHVLRAQQLRHYPQSGITRLRQPEYVLYADTQPNLRIRAATGELSQDQSLLQLQGETVIDWEGNATRPPMRILTSDLNIQPQREYAETAAAVTVTSAENWIESVGMQAWLKPPGRIRFLAQTRAHYVAQ
ncbi:LPS export ABC transporter periplasmic protein LptC [Thiolapillus sp.]